MLWMRVARKRSSMMEAYEDNFMGEVFEEI